MSPRKGLDLLTIVEAAVQIADTSGIEEVTLASLAQKLGIRSPSLYNHIEGINGLRVQMAIYGIKKLTSSVQEALADRTGDEAIHAVAAAYIAFARAHPGLYELTLRAPEAGHEAYEAAAQHLLDLLVQVLGLYQLDQESSIHVVRGLRSLLHGFASIEQKGGFGLPQSVDESLHRVINIYLAGLHRIK